MAAQVSNRFLEAVRQAQPLNCLNRVSPLWMALATEEPFRRAVEPIVASTFWTWPAQFFIAAGPMQPRMAGEKLAQVYGFLC